MLYQRLGQMLLDARLITQEQLRTAQRIQSRQPDKTMDEILISCGFLPAAAIDQLLRQQLGISYFDLNGIPIPAELASLVSENLAKKYTLVPVSAGDGILRLAMANPLDYQAVDAVRLSSRHKVSPMLAAPEAIRKAIAALYGSASAEKALRELTDDAQSPADSPETAPTIRLVNHFLEYALSQNVSDIHLEPRESEMVIRMRVDGLLRQIFTVPQSSMQAVTARVKVMGDLDVAEHRIPQDGRCQFDTGSEAIDLRISTLPTVHGEKAVIRLLRKPKELLTPTGIGLTGNNLEKFQALLETGSGMILIAGPTGSGKSSTMYTMIDALNTEQVNLVTLENPVEYHFPRVNQVQINEKTGMTFAAGLRAVLRQDPDILAVGEIRDKETVDIALRCAITGHTVLSTIHTSDALSTVDRLLDMGAEPYLIASALKGIIAQRLVRRICPHCKESYHPDASEQIRLQLPVEPHRVFYRGMGCPRCFHTGYRGRTAVFEILPVTAELRRAIGENRPREQLAALVRAEAFEPIIHNCAQLVQQGITTGEEAFRAIRSV